MNSKRHFTTSSARQATTTSSRPPLPDEPRSAGPQWILLGKCALALWAIAVFTNPVRGDEGSESWSYWDNDYEKAWEYLDVSNPFSPKLASHAWDGHEMFRERHVSGRPGDFITQIEYSFTIRKIAACDRNFVGLMRKSDYLPYRDQPSPEIPWVHLWNGEGSVLDMDQDDDPENDRDIFISHTENRTRFINSFYGDPLDQEFVVNLRQSGRAELAPLAFGEFHFNWQNNGPIMMGLLSQTHHAGEYSQSESATFTWLPGIDVNGVYGYSFVVDHSPDTIPDNGVDVDPLHDSLSATFDVPSSARGYYLHIHSIDGLGNWGGEWGGNVMHYGPFYVDTESPARLDISSPTHPQEGNWYSEDSPIFEWSEPAGPSGIQGYSYLLTQNEDALLETTLETTGTSKTYANVADGRWYFKIHAKDLAGNLGPIAQYELGIDTEPPGVPGVSSPTHPYSPWFPIVYTNNHPLFEWTVPPDLSGIVGYSHVLDQAPTTVPDETSEGTALSKRYADLDNGQWYFHIRARDAAGQWGNTRHFLVLIDRDAYLSPVITSASHPDQVAWYADGDLTFNWTKGSAPGFVSSGLSRSSSTADMDPAETGWTRTYTDLDDGTWYFHVDIQYIGQSVSKRSVYQINIDRAMPSRPIITSATHPDPDVEYAQDSPTFTWTQPDSLSGIGCYSTALDQSPTTIPGPQCGTTDTSVTYAGLGNGQWYFHIRAKNNAGTWSDETAHFAVKINQVEILDIDHTNGPLLEWSAAPNHTYVVEYSPDCHHWSPIELMTITTETNVFHDTDPARLASHSGNYRILLIKN